MVKNVFLPSMMIDTVNVLEKGIPLTKGVSDTLMINPGGVINVKSDGDGTGKLVPGFSPATFTVTEGPEGTFGPVTWGPVSGTRGKGKTKTSGTTTFFFLSDTPEPGTMLLFGTGLVALGFILRRRLAV